MVRDNRIVVVDDERDIVEVMVESLQAAGKQAEGFTNPAVCLRDIAARGATMLITDISMPEINGLELVTKVKELLPDISVIVLTGFARLDYAITALREGVDDFFLKPFKIEDLMRVVDRNLAMKDTKRQNETLIGKLRVANRQLAAQQRLIQERYQKVNGNLKLVNQSLERAAGELGTLEDLADRLARTLEMERIAPLCLDIITERLGAVRSFVLLPDGEHLVVAASLPGGQWNQHKLPCDDDLAARIIFGREPIIVSDVKQISWNSPAFLGSRFAVFPMALNNELLGALVISGQEIGFPIDTSSLKVLTSVARQMSVAISNARLHRKLKQNAFKAVESLVVSLEAKDHYTSGHSQRVTYYALQMANQANYAPAQLESIRCASLLHDIGKIGVSERILLKPGGLTSEEFAEIKRHPVIGERIAETMDFLRPACPLIRLHHERWDGQGYPDGLAAEKIPELAGIMSVADAYDAMTSERPYRSALRCAEALRNIQSESGRQFAPHAVERLSAIHNSLPHPEELPTERRFEIPAAT